MTVKVLASFIFVVFITLTQNIFAALTNQSSSTEKFITVADIHFDPFAGCEKMPQPCVLLEKLRGADSNTWDSILENNNNKKAGYGRDTNYSLLQSTLSELKTISQKEKPQFVLILGDSLAHDFKAKYKKYSSDKPCIGYNQFVHKTLQFLTYKLNETFPSTNVYPAVGNNDTYTGNYTVVPNGLFLRDAAKTWSALIKNKNNQQSFLRDFPKDGYYQIDLADHQKIIILNTVLFTSKNNKKAMAHAAAEQLIWLREQLALAQKESTHIILAFHIPSGVDVFTSFKLFVLSMTEFWHAQYHQEFEEIIAQYSANITAVLPAHIHLDAFQYIIGDKIPVIFTPSVSPIFGNNPGFKVFDYDPRTLLIKDYSVYYLSETGANTGVWEQDRVDLSESL